MTEDPILASLSDVQRAAVTHPGGPLLIFAGAGSGKTRVLTHRISYLIEREQVSPYRILAVTFTNKAAAEMKERVGQLLPGVGEQVWVSTFHSACVRMLRRDAAAIGREPNFVIYDDADQKSLIKDICKRLEVDTEKLAPQVIRSFFDQAKNNCADPETMAGMLAPFLREKYIAVCQTYAKECAKNNAFDFGDLIVKTIELLEKNDSIRELYHERLQHLLVDEFQDTNRAQFKLLRLLLGDHNNITVVGDDDQSIYSWRGAEIRNILEFEKDFPDAKTIILGENYRSTKTIIEAASTMIEPNTGRKPKKLFTQNPIGDPIVNFRGDDEYDEARYVIRKARELADKDGVRFRNMAIFYRVNSLSRVFEEELTRNAIPFQVIGGTRFYDRKEIKDVLAYLRGIVNPADAVGIKRIINVPSRGIGKASVERIDNIAFERDLPFLEAARVAVKEDALPRGGTSRVAAFLKIIDELIHDAENDGPQEMVRKAIERSGYLDMLKKDKSVEAMTRRENLDELIEAVGEYERELPDGDLAQYLEQVALVSDIDQFEPDADKLNLMTVHSAKGLEFPVVFLVGLDEGLFPHSRSVDSKKELEEERRICYVAITRARKKLFVTSAQMRRAFGGRPNYTMPSRFLNDLPEPLVKSESNFSGRSFPSDRNWKSSTPSYSSNSRYDRFQNRPIPKPKKPATPKPEVPGDTVVDYSDSQVAPPSSGGLEVGMRVRHAKFGEGQIAFLEGEGKFAVAIVKFDRVGIKRLSLQYAKLVVLS